MSWPKQCPITLAAVKDNVALSPTVSPPTLRAVSLLPFLELLLRLLRRD